jgi:cobalt-zinc-cadmium efflux system membrane fusion protein
MKYIWIKLTFVAILFALVSAVTGCKEKLAGAASEAPPQAKVVGDVDVSSWAVEHPERYPLTTVQEFVAPSKLMVTGTVAPDIARTVPVISLATGRVVDVKARLGDEVKKGQVLLRVRSDDVTNGFATYQSAVADEVLAHAQLDRAQELYKHGAIALNDLQIAKDTEDKAKIAADAAAEHVKLLGNTLEQPTGVVDIVAPVSGVITDQQITNAAGVQSLGANPFTISDLSYVWVVCDVYENDITNVKMGDSAEISLNAFPDLVLKGTVSNIGPILDPNIRTAKVRIELRNPGSIRLGMFATASFAGRKKEQHIVIPSSAILHLHDRDWVYIPAPDKRFQRVEVISAGSLPNGMQELKAGLKPGQQVVQNILSLQNELDNQ